MSKTVVTLLLIGGACASGCAHGDSTKRGAVFLTSAALDAGVEPTSEFIPLVLSNKTAWALHLDTMMAPGDGPFSGQWMSAVGDNDPFFEQPTCGGLVSVAQPGARITPDVHRASAARDEGNEYRVVQPVVVPPGTDIKVLVPAKYLARRGDYIALRVSFDWQLRCTKTGALDAINPDMKIEVGFVKE